MIEIYRKEGWVLNPNDKVVNAILKRCEANDGNCPCVITEESNACPCEEYKHNNKCHCGLYLKVNK